MEVNRDSEEYALQGQIPKVFHETNATFLQNTPKSCAASEEARKYIPGGSTRASLWSPPYGLTFESGAGSTLTDVDGRVYDDFLGEYSAGIFGHNNKEIRAAIDEALSRGWNLGGQSAYEHALAKAMIERFAPMMELVRFTNSGTEANTMALATALAWHHSPRRETPPAEPRRHKVMVFEGAYHGGTLRFPHHDTQAGSAPPLPGNPVTNPWRPDDPVNLPHEFVVAPFDDADGAAAIAQHHAEELAAIIVEPMQGNGGARLASREFLAALRRICDGTGALLVFDEVQTSRLGPQGLGARLGVRPDLMTLGKWVGGGMTFGAFGGRRHLMGQWDLSPARRQPMGRNRPALAHAGTFNNNVLSMAAGLAGLKILTPQRVQALNERGDAFCGRIMELLEEAQLGTEDDMWIQGEGSILAVHFAGAWKAQLQSAWFQFMLEKGIYFSPRGFMALSLEITDAQIDKFVVATQQFVEKFDSLIGIKETQRVVLPTTANGINGGQ